MKLDNITVTKSTQLYYVNVATLLFTRCELDPFFTVKKKGYFNLDTGHLSCMISRIADSNDII